MARIPKKVIAAGLVVLVAVGYLAASGVSSGWVYYMPVDQFTASTQYQSRRVKLCGTVAATGLEINKGQLTARFSLEGKTGKLPVVYHGVIPDMFRADSEVVVEGKLRDGVFQADSMLTKCASKYETEGGKMPAGHAAPTADSKDDGSKS